LPDFDEWIVAYFDVCASNKFYGSNFLLLLLEKRTAKFFQNFKKVRTEAGVI
jgi:hypothetical protein